MPAVESYSKMTNKQNKNVFNNSWCHHYSWSPFKLVEKNSAHMAQRLSQNRIKFQFQELWHLFSFCLTAYLRTVLISNSNPAVVLSQQTLNLSKKKKIDCAMTLSVPSNQLYYSSSKHQIRNLSEFTPLIIKSKKKCIWIHSFKHKIK